MKDNIVYLYIFNMDLVKESPTYPLLPKEIKKQHLAYYTQSRYLIRHILEKHDINPQDFFYEKSGKPSLKDHRSISLSHCDNILVIALMNTTKLGVDIQTHFMKNIPAFKKKYQLTHLTESDLLMHWTKTEAYCKATQESLFKSLYPSIDQKIKAQNLYLWCTKTPFPITLIAASTISEVFIVNEDFTSQDPPNPIE